MASSNHRTNNQRARATHSKATPRPHALDADLSARLSRAEGQLRGVQRMLSERAYCIDVLQQLSAARRALDRIALILIRDHLETCVSDAMAEHKAGGKVRELIQTLDRFLS